MLHSRLTAAKQNAEQGHSGPGVDYSQLPNPTNKLLDDSSLQGHGLASRDVHGRVRNVAHCRNLARHMVK